MCNAHNHPADCTCGWGGDGHIGRRTDSFDSNSYINNQNYRTLAESMTLLAKARGRPVVIPNTCKYCGQDVYFYANEYGSRVFFEILGKPWTKHLCEYLPQHIRNKILQQDDYIDCLDNKKTPVEDFEYKILQDEVIGDTLHALPINYQRLQPNQLLSGKKDDVSEMYIFFIKACEENGKNFYNFIVNHGWSYRDLNSSHISLDEAVRLYRNREEGKLISTIIPSLHTPQSLLMLFIFHVYGMDYSIQYDKSIRQDYVVRIFGLNVDIRMIHKIMKLGRKGKEDKSRHNFMLLLKLGDKFYNLIKAEKITREDFEKIDLINQPVILSRTEYEDKTKKSLSVRWLKNKEIDEIFGTMNLAFHNWDYDNYSHLPEFIDYHMQKGIEIIDSRKKEIKS